MSSHVHDFACVEPVVLPYTELHTRYARIYSRNDARSRSWTFYFFFAEFWLVIAEIAGGLAIHIEMRALFDARDTADAVIWPYIYRVAVMSVSTKSFHFRFSTSSFATERSD